MSFKNIFNFLFLEKHSKKRQKPLSAWETVRLRKAE